MGVVLRLIRRLNGALGLTSIIVSPMHEIARRRHEPAVGGQGGGRGPARLNDKATAELRQFMQDRTARAFHFPARTTRPGERG
jgi:hypothetical protein